MKKIIVFAGSNSSTSINQQLVSFVASKIANHEIESLKLSDYPLPVYDIDIENDEGFPTPLNELYERLKPADALLISVNEHNSGVSAFFKNYVDWLSRIDRNYLEGKKVLLMSASPGKRGGQSALEYTKGVLPRSGAEVVDAFAFPNFGQNFSLEEQTVLNAALTERIVSAIDTLQASL